MTVTIVGAGIAGVACARELVASGVDVRVLDRAGTVGGRMASPHIGGRPVDLGAAYFTVQDPEFAEVVERWRAAGLARPWTSELAVFAGGRWSRAPGPMRWAAPGGLRSLVADLAAGLDVVLQHEIHHIGPGPAVDGEPVEAVVLAMPDPQAARLVDPSTSVARVLADHRWNPVISVAAGWEERAWAELSAAFVNDHPVLTLVADDGDRRGDRAPVLVAHSTATVAREHEAEPEAAVGPVLAAVRELLGVRPEPRWTLARYWPHAAPTVERDAPFHLGPDGIGLAGDGWGRSRVETAWRSGTLLGREIARGRGAAIP